MPRQSLLKQRAEEWVEDCERRMLSETTIVDYRARMRRICQFAAERDWPSDPKKVELTQIRQYYDAVSHLSTATQKVYMDTLVQFFLWCGNRNLDGMHLRIKVSRTRVDWVEEWQVHLAIRHASIPFQRAMVSLFAYTGMRCSEVTGLRERDVKQNQIVVRGKGKRERMIPIDREFWTALEAYTTWRGRVQSEHFLVHPTPGGQIRPYAPSGIRASMSELGQKLGFHLSPHTFRRSWGRHMYMRGCGLGELQHLLGHASPEQTVAYLGIGEWDISEAVRRYRPSYLSEKQQEEKHQKMYLSSVTQTL